MSNTYKEALFQRMSGQYGAEPVRAALNTVPSANELYADTYTFAPSNAYASVNPYAYQYDTKNGASNLMADVQRAQYADYERRFQPFEDMAVGLMGTGRNTADLQYDMGRTREAMAMTAANMQGQQERAMGRYGLQYAGNIANSNEVTGATVGGLNQAILNDESRRLEMIGGAASSGATAGG